MNLEIYYNDHMFNSQVPNEVVQWINLQLDYTSRTLDSKEYQLLFLLINYSMKMFNFYLIKDIDPKLRKQQNPEWKKIKLDPHQSIQDLIKYINDSPKPNIELTVYSGIDYQKYNIMVSKEVYVSDMFISSTFDINHAMKYARVRGHEARKDGKPYILLKLIVNPNTSLIYSVYENQIIFPPKTKFKFENNELKYLPYKDILNDKFSEKLYAVNMVTMHIN